MNVKTIQIDGKMPNLALLKIRSHHRMRGDKVNGSERPDRVYISCIFDWNRGVAVGVSKMFPGSEIMIGGSGIDLKNNLPAHIENVRIDWDNEGMDYAIGFISRGCIRRCDFCIVPKKEGRIRIASNIDWIANGKDKVILLDNNLLAAPSKKWHLQQIIDRGYKVNFNQGLDIRLVSEKIAGLLADVKSYDWKFKHKMIYFAWDSLDYERQVKRGLGRLIDAGIPPSQIMIYLLCGFDTTFDQDMYRFKVLRSYDVLPYVMIYNNRKDDVLLRKFARWVNRAVYKACEWEDYGTIDLTRFSLSSLRHLRQYQ